MLSEVQGQNEGVALLRRVLEGHYNSPLLLVGSDGVGKLFSVLETAKEEFDGLAQGKQALQVSKGVHPDIVIVKRPEDTKEIGIDSIREVISKSQAYPSIGPSRYVIIDDAESMTGSAANALLKILEEPPPSTRFFLLTTNAKAVLPTVRSRCGTVRYVPLKESFVVQQLLQLTTDPTKALVCARLAEGSLGKAIHYLSSGRLTLRDNMLSTLKVGLTGDIGALFSAIGKAGETRLGLRFLEHLLHDLAMLPYDPSALTNLDKVQDLENLRQQLGPNRVAKLLSGMQEMRRISGPLNVSYHLKSYLLESFSE